MIHDLERKTQKNFERYTHNEQILINRAIAPKVCASITPLDQNIEVIEGSDKFLLHADAYIPAGEFIGVYKNERFKPVTTHFHDYVELVYVWSGGCSQTINGKEYQCERGDVNILSPMAEHSLGVTGEDDLVVNILIRKEYFEHCFYSQITSSGMLYNFLIDNITQKKESSLYFTLGENEIVRDAFIHIIAELTWPSLGSQQMIGSYLTILFTELLRRYQDTANGSTNTSPQGYRILKILDYLETNYMDCTLQSVAKLFGLHPNYLTMMLKESTGKSFLEHIHALRLKKAKVLLKNTNMSLNEIILKCGYENANFFYHKFRQEEACTPAIYRKKTQES